MFELGFHKCHYLDQCLRTREIVLKQCQVYNILKTMLKQREDINVLIINGKFLR